MTNVIVANFCKAFFLPSFSMSLLQFSKLTLICSVLSHVSTC